MRTYNFMQNSHRKQLLHTTAGRLIIPIHDGAGRKKRNQTAHLLNSSIKIPIPSPPPPLTAVIASRLRHTLIVIIISREIAISVVVTRTKKPPSITDVVILDFALRASSSSRGLLRCAMSDGWIQLFSASHRSHPTPMSDFGIGPLLAYYTCFLRVVVVAIVAATCLALC